MKKYLDETLTPQERAEALVAEMTVEEAAGQLKFEADAIPRLGVPAYNWWNEALHGLARSGTATMFPQAIGMAAAFDPDLLKEIGEITANETRAKYNEVSKEGDRDIYKGLTMWAPNINIFRDPRWGRGHETYGEDPYLTSTLGVSYVEGLQGDDEILKVAACAKHFAVHSGPESIRHHFDAIANEKDMEETYFPAFEALVKDAKVEGVMGAYNRVNGEPACASTLLMGKLKEWGFDGYFTSDCWAVRDFHEQHKVTSSPEESCKLALEMMCNINCGCTYEHILDAYHQGMISEEVIRANAVAAMRTRIRLGMFDQATPFDEIPYEIVSCKEHKDTALEVAEKSMVLLKNDGVLPLSKDLKTIAVIGPNADSRIALEGNYNGTADRYITFLTGIQDAFPGRVLYSQGCHLFRDRTSNLAQADDRLAEAVTCAKHADVSVLVLGLDSTIEGEEGDTGNEFSSGDKNSLRIPESQHKLLKAVLAVGKPVVVVLAAGSSVNIGEDVNALLQVWYPGEQGGRALANLLFGETSPSGKLPVTFYENDEALPEFTDYSMKGRTYRYTRENILYPFGYGLTYSPVACSSVSYKDGVASVEVENLGNAAVEDVLQCYLKSSDPSATPYPSLCAFARVMLLPSEKKVVELPIGKKAFTVVDEDGTRRVSQGSFTLYAGTSQPDEKSEALTGVKCVSCVIE